jgi:hypothetical protein
MNGTQCLDIICFSDHTDAQDPELPACVPYWRWIERFTPLQSLFTTKPNTSSIPKWHSDSIQRYKPLF